MEDNHLKEFVNEVLTSISEMPKSGDILIGLGENGVWIDDIDDAGDLSAATLEQIDFEIANDNGPDPGQPGVWLYLGDGFGLTYSPGELVRAPDFDNRAYSKKNVAWMKAEDSERIAAFAEANKPKNAVDTAMLDLLANVTTYAVGINDVKHYRIRPRKDSIFWIFQDPDTVGIEGTIEKFDVTRGPLAKLGLAGVAKWLFDHGAKKISPQKRSFTPPMYD